MTLAAFILLIPTLFLMALALSIPWLILGWLIDAAANSKPKQHTLSDEEQAQDAIAGAFFLDGWN